MAAGRTLVTCAIRNGRTLVAVTLQDGNDWADHEALFDYGFSAFPKETVLVRGETATLLPVIDGEASAVGIAATKSLFWPVQDGEELEVHLELPAVLAANFIIVAALLLLTLLFGRVYCSVICPLGVMQDIISWIHGKTKKKNRFRFSYSPAKNWLRFAILVLFCAGLAFGAHSLAVIIAPYSAYGRIAANLFAPLYQWGNNLLAWFAERADSYAFYSVDVWIKSVSTFVIAAVTFIVIGFLSWKHGRTCRYNPGFLLKVQSPCTCDRH